MSLVAERTGITGRPGPRARVVGRLLAAIAVGAAAVGLFVCYLRLSATFAAGSDGASNALEAWDLLHGNWLLRGWTLTDVSFYTTELPEYALVELARGLRPDVVHLAAAITYTLLVLAAAALARGRASGAEGWARALIAAGIMLAPQLGNGVRVLLAQPDHVGTQVLLLAIFLLVDRGARRWYTVAALWVLLTAAVVADKIAIVDAAVPLAFAAVLHAIWAGTARSGRRADDAGLAPGAVVRAVARRRGGLRGRRRPADHQRHRPARRVRDDAGGDRHGDARPGSRSPVDGAVGHAQLVRGRRRGGPGRDRRRSSPGCTRRGWRSRRRRSASRCGGCPAGPT